MTICDYSGIADLYEKWSSGDTAYRAVASFYLKLLKGRKGVFAELGIGSGRIAIPASMHEGVKIYGVDICDEMLKQCRLHMPKDANLELINADFMTFELPQKADIIYMPFRTIGHIMTESALKKFFRLVQRNLKEDGLFVFDHYVFDLEWAKSHDKTDILMYRDDLVSISDKYIYDFDAGKMYCTVSVNGRTAINFDFRWISVEEIRGIYPECGFSLDGLLGDFDGSLWMPQSKNQIWILRRSD